MQLDLPTIHQPKKPLFLSNKLEDLVLVAIDCQSTGASPANSELLEIAWSVGSLSAWNWETPKIQAHVIAQNEGFSLPKKISRLTGISLEMIQSGSPADAVAMQLRGDIEAQSVAAALIHFARFETPFLERLNCHTLPIFCTHKILKNLRPDFASFGLRAAAGFYGSPVSEAKRATSHVEATIAVWRGLCADLKKIGIDSAEELKTWLDTPREKKISGTKQIFHIPREKRLGLPSKPGVYEYLDSQGKVLYVGKATSLRSRVNSYFSNRRGRDSRISEMLMSAWDLRYTLTATPADAAVFEFYRINTLRPAYNMALKAADQPVFWTTRHFSVESCYSKAKEGPFTQRSGLLDLAFYLSNSPEAQLTETFDRGFLAALVEADVLAEGIKIFYSELDHNSLVSISLRSLILKKIPHVLEDFKALLVRARGGQLFLPKPSKSKGEEDEPAAEEDTQEDEVVPTITAEDISKHLHSLLKRAARHALISRWLKRMSHGTVFFQSLPGLKWRKISWSDFNVDADLIATQTALISESDIEKAVETEASRQRQNKKALASIEARAWVSLRILTQEMRRVRMRGGRVIIVSRHGMVLRGAKADTLLAMADF